MIFFSKKRGFGKMRRRAPAGNAKFRARERSARIPMSVK